MTDQQEQNELSEMLTSELLAYQRILGCAKNTVYVDPENRIPRHRVMVAEEIARRA